MAADKPKKFDETEKELEQYGSWVKGSSSEVENIDDLLGVGDPENALMTEEEEMLLNKLESSESDGETPFDDISFNGFDDLDDLDDEMDDTFGMDHPDDEPESQQSSDLSVKILQNIESELVGLRNEVKELKSELNHFQKAVPSGNYKEDSKELGATGFFEEDDDETIALTGDELDNILVSAEVDEIIMPDDNDDEIPEEYNDENLLDEDDFQDNELDNLFMDDLSLGDEDPALAELTENTIPLDEDNTEELADSDELDIPEEIDLYDIEEISTDDLDQEIESPEDLELPEMEEITADDFDLDEIEITEDLELPEIEEISADGFDLDEIEITEDLELPEMEEISVDNFDLDEIEITEDLELPEIEEISADDFNLDEIDITDDLELPEMEEFTTASFDIDAEPFEIEQFDGLDGESFTVEEYDTSIDKNTGDEPVSDISETIDITDSNLEDNDQEFDEGVEVDISIDDDEEIIETTVLQKSSVPFEDLEEIDLSSFDDSLVSEDDSQSENEDEDSFHSTEEEITIEITPESDEIVLEDSTEEEIELEEISLDEIAMDDESEIELPDLDEIMLEDDDSINIPELDEINFDNDSNVEETFIDVDENDESLSLSDIDDIFIDDPLDELFLDDEPLEDVEVPDFNDISDEIVLDDAKEEDEIDLPELNEISDELIIDNYDEDDIDIPLSDLNSEEIIDFEETPDELVIEENDDEELETLDLDDITDELIIEEDEDSEIELTDIDEILLDDEQADRSEEITLDEIALLGPEETLEIPDLDEIIINDHDEEMIPDLDDILSESYSDENSELTDMELPDIDEITIEENPDESTGNLFGDDSETVDLDSLEQLAVEEDEDSRLSDTPEDSFADNLNNKVEEIRDAALKGNVPEELKDEIKDILLYMDQLLESLPDEKIQEFARSEHFEVYKKIFEELGIKK